MLTKNPGASEFHAKSVRIDSTHILAPQIGWIARGCTCRHLRMLNSVSRVFREKLTVIHFVNISLAYCGNVPKNLALALNSEPDECSHVFPSYIFKSVFNIILAFKNKPRTFIVRVKKIIFWISLP
jgi:hypothetical protein